MILPNAVILPDISPLSYEFGGMTPVGTEIVFPNGNAMTFLPSFETQSNVYWDTYGCVSHSFENACETYLKAKYNEDFDFSDRDLIVLSGTKPGVGNSGNAVLETAKTKGLIPQELADWDPKNRDPKVNIQEVYYAYARTKEAEEAAKRFNEDWIIIGEWVPRERWADASRCGALQVYVHAWTLGENGKYINPNRTYNHAVMMSDYESVKIFDTYEPRIKSLDSWDSIYSWALKINVIKKNMDKPVIKNNSLLILVEGGGSIGLYLDGKIIVDDVAKVMAVFMARNAKNGEFTGGPVRSLTQEQWEMFEKRTL